MWPGRWPPTRRSCSWTSRSGRSTRSCGPGSRRSCSASRTDLAKTIVFVTHDIDEAIKLGDRVAILNVGGKLEQYAPPDELLREPANDFVAGFLGEDRGLKRLSLIPLTSVNLVRGPMVDVTGTVEEASAVMRQ